MKAGRCGAKRQCRGRGQAAGLTAILLALAAPLFLAAPVVAAEGLSPVTVPGFWDPKRRPERPDLARISSIRFLTEEDYPPFNFKGPGDQPIGFNVDLARAICQELALTCTIQVRRFDTLLNALAENRGDAVIASIAVTPETRQQADFSDRYFRMPARFVAKRSFPPDDVTPEAIVGKRVSVVAGSAHEAYLRAFFAETAIRSHGNLPDALAALQRGDTDLVFADGVALAFWLNGSGSGNCCAFRGGPFTESLYFGEGIGIAVKRGNDVLRQALDYALFRLWEKGIVSDLYLRYFPVGVY